MSGSVAKRIRKLVGYHPKNENPMLKKLYKTKDQKKEFEIILGNIIGSNIFNILAVIGLTTIIKPIVVQNNIFLILIIFILLTLLLPIIIYFRNKIDRIIGLFLFGVYFLFIYISFNI